MKNFLKVTILAAGLVLCLNASSFAQVDLAVYGGYAFSGTAEVSEPGSGSEDFDYSAPQFGVKGHYNLELSPTFGLGLGVFYQYAKIDFDDDLGFTPKRNTFGVDVALIFSATPEVFPYVRGYYSFVDKIKAEGESISGHGFGIGAGLEYAIMPNLRIFGELMYEGPSWDKDGFEIDASQGGFNIGLKFLI